MQVRCFFAPSASAVAAAVSHVSDTCLLCSFASWSLVTDFSQSTNRYCSASATCSVAIAASRGEIRDRPRDFQHAVKAAGRQVQARGRPLEQPPAIARRAHTRDRTPGPAACALSRAARPGRASCRSRAASTRARTAAEGSPLASLGQLGDRAPAARRRSDRCDRAAVPTGGRDTSPPAAACSGTRAPDRCDSRTDTGFIAATRTNRAGKLTVRAARATRCGLLRAAGAARRARGG